MMMKTALLAAAATMLCSAAAANAATLTFEGTPNTAYSASITRNGVVISNPAGQEQHFHELDSSLFPAELPSNGTGVLFEDRDTQIQLALATNGLFTLGNFDTAALIASGNDAGGTTRLRVTSFLANQQVAQANFAINSSSYITYNGAELGMFDRVVFDGINGGGGFVLDNVNVTAAAVPETATWGMMIAGFGVMGAAMRTRRRSTKVSFA
jgi:hypothetical protein